MLDFSDSGLTLYLLAEQQSLEAWSSINADYKQRCYDRAERLQAVANILGFSDVDWQNYKIWRDEVLEIDPRVVNR